MSKKHGSNQKHKDNTKSRAFNSGLADALSSIPLKTSVPSPLGNQDAVPHNERMSDGKTQKSHGLQQGRYRQTNITSSDINTGLSDAFDKVAIPELDDSCPTPVDYDVSDFLAEMAKIPRHVCSAKRNPAIKLPSSKLRLRKHLSENENMKNFVEVCYKKQKYWYPIHSWIPVMELCEAIYKDCDNRLLIRKESKNAILGIIQSCFDRCISLDLIDRGSIERKVRKRLDKIYGKRLELKQKRLQYDKNTKADLLKISRQNSEPINYQERIRQYRARNPNDASDMSSESLKRLEEYIAANAKRVAKGNVRTLDGAFTYKVDDARTVWIGLDYGTQNVKVAFRDSMEDDQTVILELNPSADGIGKFMISPVTLVEGEQIIHKQCGEAKSPSWKHALSFYYGHSFAKDDVDIRTWMEDCNKQNTAFSGRDAEDMVLFFASIHIAFLLETIGQAVRSYYEGLAIDDDIAFRVYMCAPVAAMDQQLSQMVFQDCLTIADEMHGLLDFSSGSIAVQNALAAYDQACSLGILLEPKTCRRSRVVPEVIAEINSYAQSKSAREGVYALVDIGAGTLDLNVFRVLSTRDDGVRTPVYAAACHPNGVKHLDSLLLESFGEELSFVDRHIEEQKETSQFPDCDALARACSHSDASDLLDRLEIAHETYCDDVANRTRVTWGKAWIKRGLEREPWTRLTLFLCGGGAKIKEIQKRLEKGMPTQIIRNVKHSVLPCPREEEFKRPHWFPDDDFHRVAVAYGLTFGNDFEANITLPSEIPVVRVVRETVDVESRYISNDMV
jgi:hypothetical protein